MGIRSRRERAKKEGKKWGDVEGEFRAACDAPLQRLQNNVEGFNALWKMMLANFSFFILVRSAVLVWKDVSGGSFSIDLVTFHTLTAVMCFTLRNLLQNPPQSIILSKPAAVAASSIAMQCCIRIYSTAADKATKLSPMIDGLYFVVVVCTVLYTRSSSRVVARTRAAMLLQENKSK